MLASSWSVIVIELAKWTKGIQFETMSAFSLHRYVLL